MTHADTLDKEVSHIVNGGFLDPLDDAALYQMAKKIDNGAKREFYEEYGEPFFRLRFTDGSDIVFQRLDPLPCENMTPTGLCDGSDVELVKIESAGTIVKRHLCKKCRDRLLNPDTPAW
jgi:hypothetical protein